MSGQKIILMKMEHIKFIDSISFLRFLLHKLSSAFGLTVSKGWYPNYFNTQENLDYVGSIPDTSYYGTDEMCAGERKNFSSGTTFSGLCYSIIEEYWRPTLTMTSRC